MLVLCKHRKSYRVMRAGVIHSLCSGTLSLSDFIQIMLALSGS